MPKLPSLSIAAKLYTIFALLATATAGLSLLAVLNAHHNSTLTNEFERAFMGAQNVERVNGLIYAVVMESRGVYMSADIPTAKRYGENLLKFNERIAKVVTNWRRSVGGADGTSSANSKSASANSWSFARSWCGSAPKSLPRRVASGGDNEANRAKRTALNKDLDILAQIYDTHSKQVYAELETGVARTKWLLGAMSIVSVLLAIAGIVLIGKAVARPLADITRVTAEVAAGAVGVVIPNVERQDEVGALARSIMIFQHAMERNAELNRTVAQDAGSGCPQPAHRERGGVLPRFGRAGARSGPLDRREMDDPNFRGRERRLDRTARSAA